MLLDIMLPDSWLFVWILLPILIFFARICDQSMGTIRLIFVSKGLKYLAPIFALFESLIWLLAIGQILQNIDNVVCIIAYCGGYAVGNFVGIGLEERLSVGTVLIRIIPKQDTTQLQMEFASKDIGYTLMDAHGARGDVKVLLSIVKRKEIKNVVNIINANNPNAFYTIEDIKSVKQGILKSSRKNRKLKKSGLGPNKMK